MRRYFLPTLKNKIILSTVLCIIIVGVPSNLILYRSLNKIITDKVATLDTIWLESTKDNIQDILDKDNIMASWCSYNESIRDALRWEGIDHYSDTLQREAVRAALKGQSTLATYIAASGIEGYLRKVVIFNSRGMSFQSITRDYGRIDDVAMIESSAAFAQALNGGVLVSTLPSHSIVDGKPCITVITPIGVDGWIYIELDNSLFAPLFEPYSTYVENSVVGEGGWVYPETKAISGNSKHLQLTALELESPGLSIVSTTDVRKLKQSNRYAIIISLAITLVSVIIASLLAYLLTNIITGPVRTLIDHIKQSTRDSDFTPNPQIEAGNDEIAAIGKTVNDMSRSITELLAYNESLFEQRKDAEIAVLQTQVNPHFLYNTLESIHWMAVVQKAPGIASMARGLSRLLKNLAKGHSDHITLAEELALIDDYQAIQQIRYMGLFELIDTIDEELKVYTIVKFTLQPLIENALFHGIEPTGRIGTITLGGWKDDTYLYITVEDDGVGMHAEEIVRLLSEEPEPSQTALTGMGIRHVDQRLKLTYGSECGLSIESEVGRFTRITVKLTLEKEGERR